MEQHATEEAAKAAAVSIVTVALSKYPSEFLKSTITAAGVSEALRPEFVNALWPLPDGQIHDQNALKPASGSFHQYFISVQNDFHALLHQGLAIKTFSDVFFLLHLIRSDPARSLNEIVSVVKGNPSHPNLASAKDEVLLASIEYVIRWWLMINVTITDDGKASERPRRLLLPGHGHRSVPWPRGKKLSEAIRCSMGQPPMIYTGNLSVPSEFSKFLNVVDMERIAGFKVVWAKNLTEHLVLRGKYLHLFSRVTALERLKASGTGNEILPEGLIEETLQTLDLLIPLDNKSCVRWITKKVEDDRVDRELRWRREADRDPEAYYYWLERLLKLSDAFEKTRPKSPRGWYYDRRDMGQWWNYWLIFLTLALTVLFGLVQSVTGLLQVLGLGPGR